MKRIDGKYYRKFRSAMGRRYIVAMSAEEVREVFMFRSVVILVPTLLFVASMMAAGII